MSKPELIFNIVRGSFVDGWGIRTTVFLKGCPLRCRWCCNPEGQRRENELRILYEHCDGCGACVSACPRGALTVTEGRVSCDRTACDGCGACVSACVPEALSLFGTLYTPEELFELVRRDKAYYQASGGGLTIGGGEASLFPAFCTRLMELCHGEGIPVAIDTCGYTVSPESLRVLESADLLLYDIKGISPEQHRRDTGVENQRIWDNLRHINQLGGPEVIVRIPVIPGHNDDDDTLREIGARLAELSVVKRVDLICYHQYGVTKYGQLDQPYPLGDSVPPVSPERQQWMVELFRSFGLAVQLGG